MADLSFVLIVCAFFGLAALLVRACDRIIGAEESAVPVVDPSVPGDEAAA